VKKYCSKLLLSLHPAWNVAFFLSFQTCQVYHCFTSQEETRTFLNVFLFLLLEHHDRVHDSTCVLGRVPERILSYFAPSLNLHLDEAKKWEDWAKKQEDWAKK
jgi:hypothetical protein